MKRQNNSFDVIRLSAALMVFFAHQWGMSGLAVPQIKAVNQELGGFGVTIFFFVSGYLITNSITSGASVRYYIASRALRILPGLIVCLLFCIFVGLLTTSVGAVQYITSKGTLNFLFGNLFPYFQEQPNKLPGVLEKARWPVVNGSLWTIKYEVLCYLVFGMVCLVQSRLRVYIVIVLISAILFIYVFIAPRLPQSDQATMFTRVWPGHVIHFMFLFSVGATFALIYTYRQFNSWKTLVILISASIVLNGTLIGWLAVNYLVCLIVIEIGRSEVLYFRGLDSIGDISYGLYLYSYIISNFCSYYLSSVVPPEAVWLISLPLIVFVALLSWLYVEKPALGKRRIFAP